MVKVSALHRPTWVYRAYDKRRVLLYVGVTNDLRSRLITHRATQWWPMVDVVTRTEFATASEARAAESAAIKTERPLYNIVGTYQRGRVRPGLLRGEKIPAKHWRAETPLNELPCVLYRVFAASGVLLYVGVTVNYWARMAAHKRSSPWWYRAYTITIKRYGRLAAGAAAEAAAIREEKPQYNVQRPSAEDHSELKVMHTGRTRSAAVSRHQRVNAV
jgi:predicted GIY-YIG superfamily endonuclease